MYLDVILEDFFLLLLAHVNDAIYCLFMLQTTKEQFHCDDCGICRLVSQVIYSFPILVMCCFIQKCIFPYVSQVELSFWFKSWFYRVGGRDKFFHCKKCGKHSDYLPGYAIIGILDLYSSTACFCCFSGLWCHVLD